MRPYFNLKILWAFLDAVCIGAMLWGPTIEIQSMAAGLMIFPFALLIDNLLLKGVVLGFGAANFLTSYQTDKLGKDAFMEHLNNNWANTSPLFWGGCLLAMVALTIYFYRPRSKPLSKKDEDESSNPPNALL